MIHLTNALIKSYMRDARAELKQYQKKLLIAKKRFSFYQDNPLSDDASSYNLAVYDAAEKQYSLYSKRVSELKQTIQTLTTYLKQTNDKTTS